ncbi:MAG: hypothetical protein LLG04_00645 [Parachlamydia sp.]|nr:hypothetical protein [Parachlamydia sp.]
MPRVSAPAQEPIKPVDVKAAQPVQKPKIGLKIIQNVALASLKEFAIAMTFAAITSTFVVTPAGASVLIITALAVVAFNTLARSLGGGCDYALHHIANKNSLNYRVCKATQTICNYLAPISFSILDSTTRDVVIHEAGHAAAASLLYQNAKPQITVNPLQGGMTSYWVNGLTKTGRFFGEKGSRLIVAGAGPAAAVLADTIQIGVAHVVNKSHPTLSRYLKITAIFSLIGHTFYAFSAFTATKIVGHDFAVLWAGGINPIVSIIAMVGLPIIVKLGLCAYDHIRAKRAAAPVA